MASEDSELLYCYNKGCGTKFDPKNNKEDSCCFHPGNPVFHDSYKGWSCCNRRSTDFTEFLNFKGCAKSFHSNVKPPEPEKPIVDKSKANEVYEYKAPAPKVSTIERPPFDSPLVKLQPEVSNVLKSQIESMAAADGATAGEIPAVTNCKNNGCKATYQESSLGKSECIYHSGVPVFHEGFKFWSCCKKKTTDFSVFVEQVGCTTGEHVWVREKDSANQASCRYDWHQTGSYVFVSVYAKKYDPDKSVVEINPIRVKIRLQFPEDNSQFDKDMELAGVVDVAGSSASMLPTKVEVKLKKAEPGSWPRLNFFAGVVSSPSADDSLEKDKETPKKLESEKDEIVDLSDIN